MSQHDYNIANGGGAAVRADLNNALAAILSQNSGATAPTTTKPFMFWYDTANAVLKMRNSADTAWIAAIEGVSNGNPVGLKNRIINGDMRIDQRNAGASVNLTTYCLDRWNGNTAGAGLTTVQRVSDAPTGFTHSAKITVSTADTSVAGDDYLQFLQMIEGNNIADLGFGTASAKSVTISFWVKSNITGTYCIGLRNGSANRSIVTNYTINSSNTWEYKTVTFAGDQSGTWATDNTNGVYVTWALYQGPTSQAANNTWVGSNARATSSISNTWPATVGNTWQITGVQFEAGPVATPFDWRPYGQELALCQRYYETVDIASNTLLAVYLNTGNFWGGGIKFAVPKRASPSMPSVTSSTGSWVWPGGTVFSASVTNSFVPVGATTDYFSYYQSRNAGNTAPTAGNSFMFEGYVKFTASSEL